MRQFARALGMLLALLAAGCVEKKYVITSDPPGALVTVNGKRKGFTPVDGSFVYYSEYDITLVKPGYEPLRVKQAFSVPWYEWPPLDFFAEILVPWEITDEKRPPTFHLQPLQVPRPDEVEKRAELLKHYTDGIGAPAAPRPLQPPPPGAPPVEVPPPGLAPPVEAPTQGVTPPIVVPPPGAPGG